MMAFMERSDILIIGGGIAGASAAYFLAQAGRSVTILERESQPGYHTTGRSAAMYVETYGNETVRAITTASRGFFLNPPPGFTDHPLVSPRGTLYMAEPGQEAMIEQAHDAYRKLVASVRILSRAEAQALCPLVPDRAAPIALLEPDAMDMDVHAIHHGFLRAMKAAGGRLVVNAEALEMTRQGDEWQVRTNQGSFAAPILINAAGAWADVVGRMAGARPIGLVPKRRTAITFDAPQGAKIEGWPTLHSIDETFYIKPEAGRLLASPCDETPMEPCDAQPDEWDIAVLADRIEKATNLQIGRLKSRWAGLRSFVADKTLVAGFDPRAPGFFWLAGQGGYGIATAPAMGRIVAALAEGRPLPLDIQDLGVETAHLLPGRFAAVPTA